uniref:Uncharacterized protein n=1 Tax=Parascaris univalens TaxID=6257 RepID=A0A915AE78_PARUN
MNLELFFNFNTFWTKSDNSSMKTWTFMRRLIFYFTAMRISCPKSRNTCSWTNTNFIAARIYAPLTVNLLTLRRLLLMT